MRFELASTVFMAAVFFVSVVSATEIVIFDDELRFGNLFDENRNGNMTAFEVRNTDQHLGQAHLARDFDASEWAWFNGIENLEIDLIDSGLEFDRSFVEFYIDSGPNPIGYMELRLMNQQWTVWDQQINIQTDGIEGYEQIRIMLKVFGSRGTGGFSELWEDFTVGGEFLDRISWGFGPNADLTLHIDSIRIADQEGLELLPGDADQDLDFDQLDLVRVQIAARYLTGQAATWGEGDWDGAPGGRPGNPPAGNSRFDQLDIIAALAPGHYLAGPYAAIEPGGLRGDGRTSLLYDASTGELGVAAPAGMELTSINIDSAAGVFTGQPAQNLGGSFDNDADNNIFKATFGSSFGSLSFGNVAQPGLSEQFVLADLTVVGSLAGGGALGTVDLIYVPEPATIVLAMVGVIGLSLCYCRRQNNP